MSQGKSWKQLRSTDIVVIDFGSATFDDDYHSTVVSTRHYRGPEVLLGTETYLCIPFDVETLESTEMGWDQSCDMWSVACILLELYHGEAIFQVHGADIQPISILTYSFMFRRTRTSSSWR